MVEPTRAGGLYGNKEIPAEFRPLLDRVLERAREVLDAGAELKPCAYLGWADSPAFTLVPFSTENPDAMDAAAYRIRADVAETRPDAVVILMEAWDAAKALAQGRTVPSEELADLLLISLETQSGYWKADVPLTRTPRGRTFDTPEMRAPAHIQGRFVGVFRPR